MSLDMMNQLSAAAGVLSINLNKLPVRDAKGRFVKRQAVQAEPVVADAVLDAVVDRFNAANPDPLVPVVVGKSLMAFHLVYSASIQKPIVRVQTRLPFVGKPAQYRAEESFMPEFETKNLPDGLMNGKGRYGVMTFTAQGEQASKDLANIAWGFKRYGFKEPRTGERFTAVYGDVVGSEGFMLFVNKASGVTSLDDLKLFVTSEMASPKRIKRELAAHCRMEKARILGSEETSIGRLYEAVMDDGEFITVLDYNMSTLTAAEVSLYDGTVDVSRPGYAKGCLFTVLGPFGLGKGTGGHNRQQPGGPDIIIYGSKKQTLLQNGEIWFGSLSDIHAGGARTDLQSMSNDGMYEPALAVRQGIKAMDEIMAVLTGTDDRAREEFFASMVKSVDTDWALARSMRLSFGAMVMPVIYRRLVQAGFKQSVDVVAGRVPIANAGRYYVMPLQGLTNVDGSPNREAVDELEGLKAGLPQVCCMDRPEGVMLAYRNPNTHSGEMILLWNTHLVSCKGDRGRGVVRLGRNAGDILDPLNGGDMDDCVVLISDPLVIAKWKTMRYPCVAKVVMTKVVVSARMAAHQEELTGIGPMWSWNCFKRDLHQMIEYGVSLGSVINNIWLDNLMSGEHLRAIVKALEAGLYTLPKDSRGNVTFVAPDLKALKKILPKGLHALIPVDYVATEEMFVRVCLAYAKNRPEYQCRYAATNSSIVIDWTLMMKGSKDVVDGIVDNSKLALLTPFFPICFKDRVPSKRGGSYILVETMVCSALNTLKAHHDVHLEESRQVEWMLRRAMPSKLLALYPSDKGLQNQVHCVRAWWIAKLDAAKEANGGSMPDDAYKEISMGYDEEVHDRDAEGRLIVTDSPRIVHVPGLVDYIFNQFDGDGEHIVLNGRGKHSTETRRKIILHWLNNVYIKPVQPRVDEDKLTMSVGDGVPNFMIDEILTMAEEAGLTGLVCFAKLNVEGRRAVKGGDSILVHAIGGEVFSVANSVCLSEEPDKALPDGKYMMSPSGVIHVSEADHELRSNFKSKMAVALSSGDTSYDDAVVF